MVRVSAITSPSLADLLRILVENQGSDLHLQCDEVPIGRIHGDLGRFRANLFYQRNKPGLVLRVIGTKILSVDQLELPEVLKTITAANEGLVLVTGATGSGIGAVLRDCQVGEGEIRTLMFITAKYKHCPDPRQASLRSEKPLSFYK